MSQPLDFFETSQLGPQGWTVVSHFSQSTREMGHALSMRCLPTSAEVLRREACAWRAGLRFLRMTNRGVHFGSLRSLRGMEPWNPTSRKNREKWGTLCRRGAYEYRDPSLGGLRLARRSPLPQDDKSRMCSLLLILFGRKKRIWSGPPNCGNCFVAGTAELCGADDRATPAAGGDHVTVGRVECED